MYNRFKYLANSSFQNLHVTAVLVSQFTCILLDCYYNFLQTGFILCPFHSWLIHFYVIYTAVYTIEFQKRGLPHAHIVLWLADGDKLLSSDEIDLVISAEIPDKEVDPIGYEVVAQLMMHGLCGEANPSCPCMFNGKCMKYYPRPYASNTTMDSDGYALYRRRDLGRTVECNNIHLDNR